MTDRGADLIIGAGCAVLAVLLLLRIGRALRTGEVPLYRTRLTREQAGNARFWVLVGVNALALVAMVVIAADLLLGLGLRDR